MGARIEDVQFRSGDAQCRAWLFVPPHDAPRPCIVVGHGLGLTRRSGLHAFGQSFSEAGFCVLVFDYRSFGESDGLPRQVISFRGQLRDWRAALNYVRSREEVDSERVATWGFSLGAGHAITVAAEDSRVAAVVAVAPMLSGLSSTLAAMKWWSLRNLFGVVRTGIADLVRRLFGRAPVTLPLSAPSGTLGLLTSPDAYPGYKAIVPSDFNFGTAAAIGLYFWAYRPGGRLRRIDRPVLLMPSDVDRINPPGPTDRFARQCVHARTVRLGCAHMEAIAEPNRSIVTRATIDFCNEVLGA